MVDVFGDVLSANARYAERFQLRDIPARAQRGLVVLTCIDSRIEPLAMLGLHPGDAKILRNAGARVTDEVLRTLVLATYLLGVERAMVIAHTNCLMTGHAEDLRAAIRDAGGPDAHDLMFLTTDDPAVSLREDVQRIRSSPYLGRLAVGGFLYDVQTGRLERLVD